MDLLGAIGGAAGAAAWALAGTRLVARLRPHRQMGAFTVGAVLFAFAGGAAGSALSAAPDTATTVRTVAVEPVVVPTTTTTVPETTTTATTPTTTTPVTSTPVVHRSTTTRRTSVRPASAPTTQLITARCMDDWGIYSRDRNTHACDAHGGVDYWIVEPTN